MDHEMLQALEKLIDGKLNPINEHLNAIDTQLAELKQAQEAHFEALEEKYDMMNEAIGVILEWADDVHAAKSLPMPRIL